MVFPIHLPVLFFSQLPELFLFELFSPLPDSLTFRLDLLLPLRLDLLLRLNTLISFSDVLYYFLILAFLLCLQLTVHKV